MDKKRPLSLFVLTMINVAAICNIKNFPLSALYGLSTVFFYGLAAIVYFIPISLVSAELATGWPKRGIYVWVKEAFGDSMGFVAIWLQWIENMIWYPTLLSFIAATIAYMFDPSLANNKIYILTVILSSFWIVTFLNFLGMKISGLISTIAALFGTIIPGALIIVLGFTWVMGGNPSQTPLDAGSFWPDLGSIHQLVIFAGILLALSGMEMSSVHALEVEDPKRGYPKAIFFSAILILVISSLGALSVAIVVPQDQINLASGSMAAFTIFFKNYGISWAVPIIAFVMAVGALGMMSTWIVGPTKGIFASALDGDLPPLFQKTNKKGMPVPLLVFQAIIVSAISLVFYFMPDVSSSYWMLVGLTVQLYLLMYILMFAAAIRLRYKQPDVERAYRIPFKNVGMWCVAGTGILASTLVFFLGFVPPAHVKTGNIFYYEFFLVGGMVFFLVIPYVIFALKRDSWKQTEKSN